MMLRNELDHLLEDHRDQQLSEAQAIRLQHILATDATAATYMA